MVFAKDEIVTISVRDKKTKKLRYFRFAVERFSVIELDKFYEFLEERFENGFYKHSFDRKVVDFAVLAGHDKIYTVE